MSLHWPTEKVAFEVFDDEGNEAQHKYAPGTVVVYVGASQVNDLDLVRYLRGIVIERAFDTGEGEGSPASEPPSSEEKIWKAEIDLMRNLMAMNAPEPESDGGSGDGDEAESDEDDAAGADSDNDPRDPYDAFDIDEALGKILASITLSERYPSPFDDVPNMQVLIKDCNHVSIG